MAEEKIPTREALEKGLADEQGMVDVVAAINGVKDNGKTYAKGQAFRMHRDLVPAHIAAGQIQLAVQQPAGGVSKGPAASS